MPRASRDTGVHAPGPGGLGCILGCTPVGGCLRDQRRRRIRHRTLRRGLGHVRRRLQEIEHVQRHRPHGRVVPAGDCEPAPQGANPNDRTSGFQRDVDRDPGCCAPRQRVLDRGANVGGDLRRQVRARRLIDGHDQRGRRGFGRPGDRDHRRQATEQASQDDGGDRRFHHGEPFDELDDRTGAEGKPTSIFPRSAPAPSHQRNVYHRSHHDPRPSLPVLPLLALAGCATERKPLTGYDKQPPGILLDGTSRVMIWPIFDLPPAPSQIFRVRLNGQDGVIRTSDEGFYDYEEFQLQNWTGGYDVWLTGTPPGTYMLELVDSAGQSWGQSPPLTIPPGADFSNLLVQLPAVIFTHYEGQAGSWTVDPTLQDADTATDEITVTNLIDEDVAVERCLIYGGLRPDLLHARRHRRAGSRPPHRRDAGGLVDGRPPGPLHPPRKRRQPAIPAGPRPEEWHLRSQLPDGADPRPRQARGLPLQPGPLHRARHVLLLRVPERRNLSCPPAGSSGLPLGGKRLRAVVGNDRGQLRRETIRRGSVDRQLP